MSTIYSIRWTDKTNVDTTTECLPYLGFNLVRNNWIFNSAYEISLRVRISNWNNVKLLKKKHHNTWQTRWIEFPCVDKVRVEVVLKSNKTRQLFNTVLTVYNTLCSRMIIITLCVIQVYYISRQCLGRLVNKRISQPHHRDSKVEHMDCESLFMLDRSWTRSRQRLLVRLCTALIR